MAEILRIFPRRTKATPDDPMVIIGDPPLFRPDADEVHVSVTFTYDCKEGERLKRSYEDYYPVVKIGGPGMGDPGGEFISGRYLKPGYVITSRGCPNKCWFCDVWRREGGIRELPITEGWNVLDDNLLACSESHILDVFNMLAHQPHRSAFTGGLEAKRITKEIARHLKHLNPKPIYTAYDSEDREGYIRQAGKILSDVGFNREILRCFVLIGYPKDTIDAALIRLQAAYDAGFMPMAMLYRDHIGERDPVWTRFARSWTRPAAIKAMCKGIRICNKSQPLGIVGLDIRGKV